MTATVSIVLTVILIVIGLIIRPKVEKKTEETKTVTNSRTDDEIKNFWHWLGFVDLTPNVIRAIVAGNEESGPILRYIANVKGRIYDKETKKMRDLEQGEDPFKEENSVQKRLRTTFGKVWIGFPYLRATKPIVVDRVVRKNTKDILTGKAEEHLSDQLSSSTVKRYGLYGEIFRPTLHKDLDTTDGVRFTVISYAVIRVVDPEPGFTVYNDNLLQAISSLISSFISSKVLKMKWEGEGGYKQAGHDREKFASDYPELNQRLETLGVEIVHLMMSDPELNPAIQSAMEAKTKAEQQAEAKKKEGQGEKEYRILVAEGERQKRFLEAEGDAQGIERIAKARAQRFTELYEVFKGKAFSDADAMEAANKQIIAEFSAEAIGKLTTYVAGPGGVQVSIPTNTKEK